MELFAKFLFISSRAYDREAEKALTWLVKAISSIGWMLVMYKFVKWPVGLAVPHMINVKPFYDII